MKKIDITLRHSKSEQLKVGSLAGDEQNIYFEFDADFLTSKFDISPIMLPKKSGVHTLKHPAHLKKLWGVFHDSLPDGWGLLLMDRYFRKQGINPAGVSLIERLLFIGSRATGALTYNPSLDLRLNDEAVDLDFINDESQKILSGSQTDIIPQLLKIGGSPGGARPKIFVGMNKNNEVISGVDDLPEGYEHWIVKFNSKGDLKDAGAIEYVYSQMALIAGLEMSESKLVVTKENKRFFATKRFDRVQDKHFHLHTFANLVGADFRIPATDYQDILKTSYNLTKSHQDLEKIFRVMVFNIMAHNRDDHSKNFSFMMDHHGQWRFAPAYDLTFSHGPGLEHSNSIMGEGKNPSIEHVLKIADQFSIKKKLAHEIIDQTAYALSNWEVLAQDLDIAKKDVRTISNHFLKLI